MVVGFTFNLLYVFRFACNGKAYAIAVAVNALVVLKICKTFLDCVGGATSRGIETAVACRLFLFVVRDGNDLGIGAAIRAVEFAFAKEIRFEFRECRKTGLEAVLRRARRNRHRADVEVEREGSVLFIRLIFNEEIAFLPAFVNVFVIADLNG